MDFLGYIVRPDYLLVRRRMVSRLKTRLRDSARKLVHPRPGYTLFRHDPAVLARLRATWASYRAHLKMANSYRLWQRLVSRYGWVRHFFTLEGGLLVPRVKIVLAFRRLRDQYRFFAEQFSDAVLLLQVGCFYEVYDEQAGRASRLLGLKLLAQGRGGWPAMRHPNQARRLFCSVAGGPSSSSGGGPGNQRASLARRGEAKGTCGCVAAGTGACIRDAMRVTVGCGVSSGVRSTLPGSSLVTRNRYGASRRGAMSKTGSPSLPSTSSVAPTICRLS